MEPLEYASMLANEAHAEVKLAADLMEDAMQKLGQGRTSEAIKIMEQALRSSEVGRYHIGDALREAREVT